MELVINTFGAMLNRDNEAFIVGNKDGRTRVSVDKIQSIQIGQGVQVTSDAVMLAIENNVEIYFNNRAGEPLGRVWSPKYGSISTIRKGQLNFTLGAQALTWIKDVIVQKMGNQQALLLMMQSENLETLRLRDKAISRIEDYRTKIKTLTGTAVSDVASSLRGWEGVASKIYFESMNLFLPEQFRFKERTQHPAMDVVNAMLNYGYGMLYGKVEGALIKAGIDPYIGVLHRDDYNRPVLVYDVIELYRVWVDYVVWKIVLQGVVSDDCYSISEDGSYWLENLGRRILIQSMNDYLDEIVPVNRQSRSRFTHILLYAQNLAQTFKQCE